MSRFEPAKTDELGLLGKNRFVFFCFKLFQIIHVHLLFSLDYYCMDGACILPIIALDVQPFHSVLDLCSAPGGKALNIFHMCPYSNRIFFLVSPIFIFL
jgi:hypothetical protein